MKMTVFGATGRTGRRVVEQALAKGHQVTAVARSAARVELQHERLSVVEGDMLNPDDVRRAVDGADVVIMAAGPVKSSPADMLERAARAIVDAMRTAGVRKLVWLTGAGVLDSRDGKAVSRSIVRGLMKVVAGKVLAGSERAYGIVTSSGLDYTVVRPPMLAEEPRGTGFEAGYTPPQPIPVGRGDLAAFLIEAAESDTWRNESPLVGYRQRVKAS